FVDLLSVVRQALRASVEHYSIKDLEPFYGLERGLPLRDAARARALFEQALEVGEPGAIGPETRRAIEFYNRDDCVSAMKLRDWLEFLRTEQIARGVEIGRPAPPEDGAPRPELDERERRAKALAARLTSGVPLDAGERTAEQRAHALLADLLEWHRREEKAPWWDYFRLLDLSDEELMDERAAIAGLTFVGPAGGTTRRPIERYAFPPQETSVREEDELHARDLGNVGEVAAIDFVEGWVDVCKRGANAGRHPTAAFAHKVVRGTVMAESLFRLGQWVADHGLDADGPFRAARDLLLNRPPRLVAGVA